MVYEYIAAEFAHVIFGMMWVGTSLYSEVVLAPIMRRARTSGDYRTMLAILGRTSQFQGMSAILVLLTGTFYMFMRYPVNRILSDISGQLVLASLFLVLLAIFIGFAFLRPTAVKIMKTPWPMDAAAPVPDSVRELQRKLLFGTLMSTIIVVFVLFLMVAAVWL